MSRFSWGVVLVLLCISLVVSAPARLLNLLLPADQVLMQGFGGTLWRGNASRTLVRAGPGYLHLGAVRWSLDPRSLLLLAPRLTLSSVWGSQVISGDLVLRGPQELDLYEFEAVVAADLLRQFVPVALTGTLSAQLDNLQLRNGLPHSGAGRLVWQNGGWESPGGSLPLGTYALDFHQVAEEILRGEVVTVAGPVAATGTVELHDRNYRVDILVSSQVAMDAQLQQALSLIAVVEPGGYRIVFDGEL
ncbi:MAG: type II secretion system protein N [Gammaproteobacteria bacterium]|nr:MAG: type II secretion system protein N [Gammaproteobacteria bacterium]RLA59797.1 MAG: type II secretion system protein N [Gammaproteobacteria bacterium]